MTPEGARLRGRPRPLRVRCQASRAGRRARPRPAIRRRQGPRRQPLLHAHRPRRRRTLRQDGAQLSTAERLRRSEASCRSPGQQFVNIAPGSQPPRPRSAPARRLSAAVRQHDRVIPALSLGRRPGSGSWVRLPARCRAGLRAAAPVQAPGRPLRTAPRPARHPRFPGLRPHLHALVGIHERVQLLGHRDPEPAPLHRECGQPTAQPGRMPRSCGGFPVAVHAHRLAGRAPRPRPEHRPPGRKTASSSSSAGRRPAREREGCDAEPSACVHTSRITAPTPGNGSSAANATWTQTHSACR